MNWLYTYISNIIHPQPKDEIEKAYEELEARIEEGITFERSWRNILLARAMSDAQKFHTTQALYVEPK